jgi:hypothetical protein
MDRYSVAFKVLMIIRVCLLFFGFLSLRPVAAQVAHDDLTFYADVMIHASKAENRMYAAGKFHELFREQLGNAAMLASLFRESPWIRVETPADSTFRLITWQVQDEASAKYYGFIQFLHNPSIAPVELRHARTLRSEHTQYDQDTWYGALYYGIQPFRTADKRDAWILLGFQAGDGKKYQRVADILTIDEGHILFGMPVFYIDEQRSDTRSRVILEYATTASATMRFDREKELLIYDHVIPIQTPEGPVLVPDGSYHGYQYKRGMWHFVDKVFDVIVDEPPGGRPTESVKRDLFGRERNN